MVYGRQRRFQIAGPSFSSEKINFAKDHKVEVATPVDNSLEAAKQRTSLLDDEISSIIKGGIINMMQSQQEMTATQIAALKGLIEAGRPQQDDSTMQMMMKSMEMQNALVIAMVQNRPEPPPPPDPTELMMKMAEVWKGLSSPASSIKDQLSTINEFIGVRQAVDDYHRGPESEPEDFVGFAMKRFDKLIELISASKSHEELKQNIAALPPAQPQPQSQPQPEGAMWRHAIKGQIPKYVTLAQRGLDPVQAAEVDYGAMPDAAFPVIKELLSGDNPLGDVVQAFPQLAPHAEWVNLYLGRMHQLAFPEQYAAPEGQKGQQGTPDTPLGGFGPQGASEGLESPDSGALVMDEDA
jgi:hypothetical protein